MRPYTGHPAQTGAISSGPVVRNIPSQARVTRCFRHTVRTPITTSTTQAVVNNYTFALSDMLNYTEFTSLYDAYRIRSVELVFIPRVDTSIAADIWTDPRLYTAVDFDGNTIAAASINSILEYDTCQVHDPRTAFTIKLVPRASMALNTSGFAETPEFTWIDCATPDVLHYGVVCGLLAQNVVTVITVTARYEVEFKRAR